MLFRILGPFSVVDEEREIPLGGVKQRSLLALLVVNRNQAVTVDRLIDLLWGEQPPETAAKTVQVYVSRLRRLLGEGRIETKGHGYELAVHDGELDLDRFESLVGRAETEPPEASAATLREALALYRAEPLQDLVYEPWARGEIERLEEKRLEAFERRVDAELELGRHAQVVADVEAQLRAHPLRERLRGQLMLALYRGGRQADALEVYREGRVLLDETLGLEPGPDLRGLEQRILRQDQTLAGPPPRLAERVRRQRGVRLVVAGAVVLLAAAVAAVLVATRSSSGRGVLVRQNSVAAIDPRTNRVVAVVPVGKVPSEIVAGTDAVWVLNAGEGAGTVTRIDAASRHATGTFSVPGSPRSLAFAGRSLWIGTSEGKVVAVDPESGVVDAAVVLRNAGRHDPFASDTGAGWVASGPSAVWASSLRTVTRIDPSRLTGPTVVTAKAWGRLAFGLGSVWVLGDFVLLRLDPVTLRRLAGVEVGAADLPFAAGAGAVWLPDDTGRTVIRVDPVRDAVVRTLNLDGRPLGVAVGAGAVWAAVDDGTVVRIDPETNATTVIRIGGRPRGVAVGAGLVWVTVD